MHCFERCRCLLVREAFVCHESILKVEFFEEPDDSLSARSVQPMQSDAN
jgi:hypothetical protein